jgi:hypothetical protein
MKTILTSVTMMLIGLAAHAANTSTLIALNSEAVPGKTAYLGVNTNDSNQITSIYYKGIYGTVEQFSLTTLSRSQQVLFSQSGYNLITLAVGSASATSANLKLTYTKNAISGIKASKSYHLGFNPSLGKYELQNTEGRVVQHGYITTNRNALGMQVGIADVKTW